MIVGIAGPTAAGKSDLALRLGRAWDAVIVSADAMMVYRGMDIGTAKPSREEQAIVEHFGLDVARPDEPFDAAAFVALAEAVLRAHPRVIVVGGTHLYLRALLRGLVDAAPLDPSFRATLASSDDLWQRLAAIDPVLAERLHPNDRMRLVRGLEAHAATGHPLSALHAEHAAQPDRHQVAGIWVDREDLDDRIDRRVEEMVASGYRSEVEQLLAAGYADCKPMGSLGYRHFASHIRAQIDLAEAVRATRRDTRRFARKQRNWRKVLGWERPDTDPWEAANRAAERAWAGPGLVG